MMYYGPCSVGRERAWTPSPGWVPKPLHKVVMVGDRRKNALAWRFTNTEVMSNEYYEQDNYMKNVVLDGEDVQIHISFAFDEILGGTDRKRKRNYKDYLSGEGFLLVFSITDQKSFIATIELREKILRVKGKGVPLLLVGNNSLLENERKVSSDEAAARAAEWGVRYVETCTQTRAKVDKVFFDIMREIRKKKPSEKREEIGVKCCIL